MKAQLSEISLEYFADDGQFPNSTLPVVIYKQVLPQDKVSAEDLETLFERNGWPPQWRDTVFTFHHFHSQSHECLGIARGNATLRLGGPQGREFRVLAGDVVLIPAGVAHQRVTASSDFMVVGAYPPGQENFDTLRGQPDDRPKADQNIAQVPLPATDPVGGQDGPVVEKWA